MRSWTDALREKLPPHTLGIIDRYVGKRIPPGGFIEAVLTNNLIAAVSRADAENSDKLKEIVTYMSSCLPMECWGTQKRVDEWLKGDDYDDERN